MFKLFRELNHYRWFIVGVIALTIVQTGSELFLPTLMSDIVDIGIVDGDLSYIYKVGSAMLAIAILGAVGSAMASYLAASISAGFGHSLRERTYAKAQGLRVSDFHRLGASSLITRTTNDVTQVQNVLQMMLRIMLMAPIMCIGGVVMALSQDVKLSSVLLVGILLLIAGILLIMKAAFPVFRTIQQRVDRMNLVIREALTGVRVIRAFHRLNWERERFAESNESLRDQSIAANRIMSLNMPVISMSFNLSTILILWFGAERVSGGNLQVGELMAFIQYAGIILMSIVMFSFLFGSLPRAMVSAARLNELLDMPSEPCGNRTEDDRTLVDRLSLSVEFRNVSYRYPGSERTVLSGISFRANEGEVTAIIGGTGAGKSTLLQMVPRLLEPEEGQILIGGIDVATLPLLGLREIIGYVPQKAEIFSDSIAGNIRYGTPDAGDEDVRRAAEVAQAARFIMDKEEGFDSLLAQRGTNLSGGQKQRLSIARALARNPRIYLFDDSFSALDYKTDAKLRAELRSHLRNQARSSILFIVAQRIRSVIDADQIIVLNEGRIAAIGTHRDLMETSEDYREIVKSQENGEGEESA
ncbi:ABC transporter ATP-binding protein [Cohnella herbarum]|uniref:ABC transporter ATP-binding protein n=1 Tax=Cohnella herbarum TaxID=2728023 RepID=A0A7Z2VKR8_9BACL|nr:ABC transporter ATP-binding protein [Cohnella herbarum]QJD85018.1 ABC transporter ATP-binding protein [Cohnella herbarum]